MYVASMRWQLPTEVWTVWTVIWSIFFLQATHSLMQEVSKLNNVEIFLKIRVVV